MEQLVIQKSNFHPSPWSTMKTAENIRYSHLPALIISLPIGHYFFFLFIWGPILLCLIVPKEEGTHGFGVCEVMHIRSETIILSTTVVYPLSCRSLKCLMNWLTKAYIFFFVACSSMISSVLLSLQLHNYYSVRRGFPLRFHLPFFTFLLFSIFSLSSIFIHLGKLFTFLSHHLLFFLAPRKTPATPPIFPALTRGNGFGFNLYWLYVLRLFVYASRGGSAAR